MGFNASPIWLGLSPRFKRLPVPSCPDSLKPQHFSSPPSSSAQTEPLPDTEIAVAFLSVPRSIARSALGTVLFEVPRFCVSPSPSSPEPLNPQHLTRPVDESAHVVLPPSARAIGSARQVAL